MEFKELKKKIIVGTWSWSGMYKTINNKNIFKLIEASLENGFNEFDTSPSYKKVDKILSIYKKNYNKIKINTKCGWDLKLKRTYDVKKIKEGIENSLEKYKKINVLQLHNPRNEIKDWDEIVELFEEYKKKKLISFYGLSLARNYYFPIKIMNKFDFIQDEFNLLRIDPLKKVRNFRNIYAIRSVFANGILTNNFTKKSKYKKNDHRSLWLFGERKKNILRQVEELKKLSKRSIYELALSFVLSFSFIDKYIFGYRNINQFKQLLDNLKNFKKLNSEEIKNILNLHNYSRDFINKVYSYNNNI